jgi:hypothetical protein
MKRVWLVLGALSLAACSRRAVPPDQRCAAVDAGSPVDPLLLAFLSRARAAHHLADDHESFGDLAQAGSSLTSLVAGPLPRANGAELAPEVHEVLADTLARLADLHSRLGSYEAALADVRAGLEHAREANYFRGHLLETEGLVEERRAQTLDKSDPVAAQAVRRHAIDLLEQAMAVQSGVLEATPSAAAGRSNPTGSDSLAGRSNDASR